ncbi:MAG: PLP-dependent cysteine synthase family protein [Candidatus Geothermarchaeales archaeon]
MAIDWKRSSAVLDDLFDGIGRTPLVRLRQIPEAEGVEASVLGKVEYVNPTGSLKDRIYFEMITRAIEDGRLRPGMEIVESSTGNAGIACAFVGGRLGYRVSIVLPAGMSEERMKIIRAYGGNVITTPGGESDVDLCMERVAELKRANPGRYWEPNQFGNPDNVAAHYKTTGPEIWEQTGGRVDCFVASQGTGGTLTGVGRFLREKNPEVALYAVEPAEAPMLSERRWGSHRIEGIGDGFVPPNLDLSLLNGVVTTTSEEALEMARRLSLEEGLFCGVSSGCNVAAAVKVSGRHPELGTIVTMINDTGQRYFSTELCGVEKEMEIPEREHPLDPYTVSQLDRYQSGWEFIG